MYLKNKINTIGEFEQNCLLWLARVHSSASALEFVLYKDDQTKDKHTNKCNIPKSMDLFPLH